MACKLGEVSQLHLALESFADVGFGQLQGSVVADMRTSLVRSASHAFGIISTSSKSCSKTCVRNHFKFIEAFQVHMRSESFQVRLMWHISLVLSQLVLWSPPSTGALRTKHTLMNGWGLEVKVHPWAKPYEGKLKNSLQNLSSARSYLSEMLSG